MPMINFTNPIILLVVTLVYVLILILSKETKKSAIAAVMLFAFVAMLVIHIIMYATSEAEDILSVITYTMIFDLIFVLLSFIAYLWVDDIEAKLKKKKSIDNSLDWFWGKV